MLVSEKIREKDENVLEVKKESLTRDLGLHTSTMPIEQFKSDNSQDIVWYGGKITPRPLGRFGGLAGWCDIHLRMWIRLGHHHIRTG